MKTQKQPATRAGTKKLAQTPAKKPAPKAKSARKKPAAPAPVELPPEPEAPANAAPRPTLELSREELRSGTRTEKSTWSIVKRPFVVVTRWNPQERMSTSVLYLDGERVCEAQRRDYYAAIRAVVAAYNGGDR